ncbi:MAG: hypothetical protein AAF628_13165 [Planctomycetota bacterium]
MKAANRERPERGLQPLPDWTPYQLRTFPAERKKSQTKPGKRKCASVSCVWADIDPPAGCEDLVAWRAEQVEALLNHDVMPSPHVIINSGSGLVPIWLLAEPFEIDGDKSRWTVFERTTRAVVALFEDGDSNTWNVDRLLRLPFTTNFPDKKKREKGRVECRSGILLWDVERPRYSLDDLPKKESGAPRSRRRGKIREASVPASLMEDLAGKEFEAHHQPLLEDLASWDCVLGDRLPDSEVITLPDGRSFDNDGAWETYIAADLPPYEQIEKLSDQGLDCLFEGERNGRWSIMTDNNAEACSFAFSAIRAGIPPRHVASILTHEMYPISRHCRDAGGHADKVRAARRCVGQAISLLEAKVEEPGDVIDLSAGREGDGLADVGRQLGALDLFERGGEIVRPIRTRAETTDDGVKRERGTLIVERMTPHSLKAVMSRYCRFMKWDGRARDYRDADPSADFARTFLSDRESWCFRPLDGVTGAPVFRPDGEIVTEPGYDPGTALWLDTDGLELPPIPERPTREDAEAALKTLMRPFREYPIPDEACLSALAALMIAPVITPSVEAVPAVGITSASPGFGKTKIQECVGALATGTKTASFSQAERDEENDKRLDAALLAGDPLIAIDNAEQPVGGPVLCSIVTGGTHKPRVLGRSEMPAMPSRVQVIVNGVNLAFRADACRRGLLVVIDDPDEEHPERRKFDFDPVHEVQGRRGEMLAAAPTILRAWHLDGRPVPDGHEPLGSFGSWEPVRLALIWLGMTDPMKSQAMIYADDPERELRRELLDLLWLARERNEFMGARSTQRRRQRRRTADPAGRFSSRLAAMEHSACRQAAEQDRRAVDRRHAPREDA